MKKDIYTKDKLISIIIDGQKQTTAYMGKLSETLSSLNDNSVLHRKAIEVNTTATEEMATGVNSMLSMFKWVIVALVLAIISLAGAEKIIHLIPFLK